MFDLLHPVLAALANFTTNSNGLPTINIPATITPVFPGQAPTASNTVLDAGTITGIIGMITAAYSAIKNHNDDKKQDDRATNLANAQLSTVDSLKSTDIGVKENIDATNKLVQTLAKYPELKELLNDSQNGIDSKSILEIIKSQSVDWGKSIQDYYHNLPSSEGNYSKDPVINKTADVLKQTKPNTNS